MKVLIVIEQVTTGLSAYSPDIPGCIATGATREEVERDRLKDRLLKEVAPLPHAS